MAARISADVAVIGAGPAGAAVAIALARAGRRVVLADRNALPCRAVGESVPPSIRMALERLGVWREFESDGHVPSLGNRSAWGSPVQADRDFLFSPYGHGWHLDRPRFDMMLRRAALAAGADTRFGRALSSAKSCDSGWRLRLEGEDGGLEIDARFVIDASGRAAAFARHRGVRHPPLDHLIGAVAYFDRGATAARVTLVEAAEDGWWYSAPLPDRRLVAAYMTDAGRLRGSDLRAGAWYERLARSVLTRERITRHGGRLEAEPLIVPAYSACLSAAAGRRWLAAGDAAASFDPLSSQGISTALDKGLEAAAAVDAALATDDEAPLAAYAAGIRRTFEDYLAERSRHYRLEQRWPASHFWRQRWNHPGLPVQAAA